MRLRVVRMGAGSPVVLLHGLFGSASNWGRIQKELAGAHDVLAMDLRNHGGSPHDPAMSYPLMAEDVAETLAAEGLGAAAVLGHSMGGKVAMQLALARPAVVTRLIVGDVAPVRYPPHFDAIAAAMLRIPLDAGLTRAAAAEVLGGEVADPVLRGFLLQNLRFGGVPGWRIGLVEIAGAMGEISDWTGVGVYEGPVLVLRGETSDYILPEHRGVFRALFPLARFASLRGAGHWLHADAPEAFLATVGPFLRG